MKPPNPPPLSDNHSLERRCSRALTWPQKPGDPTCQEEAFLHVLWTTDMDAGFVCVRHSKELTEKNWIPVQAHEMGDDCGMPGSLWSFDENRCYVPDEPVEAVVTKAVGVPAGERTAAA